MKRIGSILLKIGKFLLWTLLVLAVIVGAVAIWLRIEPAEVTECDAGFVLFEHTEGVDCIPEKPERVVSLSATISQFLVAVDHKPAGVIDVMDTLALSDIPGLDERWQAHHEGIPRVAGLPPELESLLSIQPDLVMSEFDLGNPVKVVETFAPYVVFDFRDWKGQMVEVGEVIGEKEAAEQMLGDYNERVEILRAQFDDPAAITVSSSRVFQETRWMNLPNSFAGQVIADVGFSFPEAQLETVANDADFDKERTAYEISDERLDLLDADYVFLYDGWPEAMLEDQETSTDEMVGALMSNPLFQTLGAMESDQVERVGMYWEAQGIYSAHAVLDDLFIHVAGVDPEEVAPNPLVSKQ
ncbi:MAG: ABC transporter substrate-binding protein [Chloroflexota bacterium]